MSKIEFKNPWAQGNNSFDRWFENEFDVETTDNIGFNPQKSPRVLDAFWTDKQGRKIDKLPFGEDKAYVVLKFNSDAIGENYKVSLTDDRSIHTIYRSELKEITSQEIIFEYEFKSVIFRGENLTKDIYITAKIPNKSKRGPLFHSLFKSKRDGRGSSKILTIHAVRFIPKIMENSLGWINGANVQKAWFNGEKYENAEGNPKTNFISMDWVLRYSVPRAVYYEIVTEKMWVNEAGKNELVKQLRKMVSSGELVMPTENNQVVSFGSLDASVPSGNLNPIFDKYYHQSKTVEIDYTKLDDSDLNDFMATLANCQFRITAQGQIVKIDETYKINISNIGIYIKDKFNFIDSGVVNYIFSQQLGYWSFTEFKASTKRKNKRYLKITNDSYNDWREFHQKGGDYELYSDVKKIENLDDYFTIDISTF